VLKEHEETDMATQLTEAQARIIARLGLDPNDNHAFLDGFDDGEAAVKWFLEAGWPLPERPATDDERHALQAYAGI
jgi:hypothetical protein